MELELVRFEVEEKQKSKSSLKSAETAELWIVFSRILFSFGFFLEHNVMLRVVLTANWDTLRFRLVPVKQQ